MVEESINGLVIRSVIVDDAGAPTKKPHNRSDRGGGSRVGATILVCCWNRWIRPRPVLGPRDHQPGTDHFGLPSVEAVQVMTPTASLVYTLAAADSWKQLNEEIDRGTPDDLYWTLRAFGLEGQVRLTWGEQELVWGGFLLDLACALAKVSAYRTRHSGSSRPSSRTPSESTTLTSRSGSGVGRMT